jgi:RNA polymerase sigma factor (sigma-70 family)
MNTGPLQAIVRRLCRVAARAGGSPSDCELLSRFVTERDDAAFAEIVQRHGPLVWALCRSRLPAADADDAFQATFLVLARNAGRIRKPASLAAWLSGVSRRVVHQARRETVRRRRKESRAEVRTAVPDDSDHAEWRGVLNEELERLPDKYRLPTMLCYYQGLTNEEAARRLGWPHGTVCGRLARARELLRRRLAHRGLTLAAATLATGVTGPPLELLAATFKVCGRLSEGVPYGEAVTRSVRQLVEGTMYAMWLGKVKTWAAGVLALVVLGGSAAGWALHPVPAQAPQPDVSSAAAQPPKVIPNPPAKADFDPADFDRVLADVSNPSRLAVADAADDELLKLRKELYRVAAEELKHRLRRFIVGAKDETGDMVLGAAQRFAESEVNLSERPTDHVAACERWVRVTKLVRDINEIRF